MARDSRPLSGRVPRRVPEGASLPPCPGAGGDEGDGAFYVDVRHFALGGPVLALPLLTGAFIIISHLDLAGAVAQAMPVGPRSRLPERGRGFVDFVSESQAGQGLGGEQEENDGLGARSSTARSAAEGCAPGAAPRAPHASGPTCGGRTAPPGQTAPP